MENGSELPDRWLNEKEAAKMLGTTAGNLRRARCDGWLYKDVEGPPFIKPSERKVVYSENDLIEYMKRVPRFRSNADYHASTRTQLSEMSGTPLSEVSRTPFNWDRKRRSDTERGRANGG